MFICDYQQTYQVPNMVKLSFLHDNDFSFLLCECFSWYTSSEITIIRSGRYRQSICLGRSFSVRLPPFIARFAILNRISGTDSPLMSTLHHLLDTRKLGWKESVFVEQVIEYSFGLAELHLVITKTRDISVSVSCISPIIASMRQIALVSITGALAW